MKIRAKVGVAFGEPGTGSWDVVEVTIPPVAGEQVEHYAIVEARYLIEELRSEVNANLSFKTRGARIPGPVVGYFLIEHKHIEEGE